MNEDQFQLPESVDNEQPRWVSAMQSLKSQIEGGLWAPGMRIPSERALTRRLGFSRNTIRQAISELTRNGYLFREVGRGTFVKSRKSWGEGSRITKEKLVGVIVTDMKGDFGKKIVRRWLKTKWGQLFQKY